MLDTLTAADMTAAEQAAWDVAVNRGMRITRADLRALMEAASRSRAGEIFIVLVQDRYGDAEAIPFTTQEAAIGRAQAEVEKNARHPELIEPEDRELTKSMIADGWVWRCHYSVECCVCVIRRELDPQ
jgi:hypothetical protein